MAQRSQQPPHRPGQLACGPCHPAYYRSHQSYGPPTSSTTQQVCLPTDLLVQLTVNPSRWPAFTSISGITYVPADGTHVSLEMACRSQKPAWISVVKLTIGFGRRYTTLRLLLRREGGQWSLYSVSQHLDALSWGKGVGNSQCYAGVERVGEKVLNPNTQLQEGERSGGFIQ